MMVENEVNESRESSEEVSLGFTPLQPSRMFLLYCTSTLRVPTVVCCI